MLKENDVEELAVTHRHAELAARRDWSHRDPWDRLPAAQAILKECIFVSTDEEFDIAPSMVCHAFSVSAPIPQSLTGN